MVSKLLACLRPVAENLEGVGLDPVDFGGQMRERLACEIALRYFERGARGVDARDLAADLGKVQGESALVAADVEGAALIGFRRPGAAPIRARLRSWCAGRETRRSFGRRWRRSERRGR